MSAIRKAPLPNRDYARRGCETFTYAAIFILKMANRFVFVAYASTKVGWITSSWALYLRSSFESAYKHEAVHVCHPKLQFEHLNHLLKSKRFFPSERKVHKAVCRSSAAARFWAARRFRTSLSKYSQADNRITPPTTYTHGLLTCVAERAMHPRWRKDLRDECALTAGCICAGGGPDRCIYSIGWTQLRFHATVMCKTGLSTFPSLKPIFPFISRDDNSSTIRQRILVPWRLTPRISSLLSMRACVTRVALSWTTTTSPHSMLKTTPISMNGYRFLRKTEISTRFQGVLRARDAGNKLGLIET